MQTRLALEPEPLDPRPDAFARHSHRRSDVSLLPASLVPANNQQPTMNSQPRITVGHENLRVKVGLRQATPHSGVLSFVKQNDTKVMSGYN